MKCPNCGTPEKARVRVCGNCGTTYASEDLLEYRQLEFLLTETSSWIEAAARRAPYVKRFQELKARLLPAPKPQPAPEPVAPPQPRPQPLQVAPMSPAPMQQPKPIAAAQAPAQIKPIPPAPPKPKAEAIPFDQWLLSERNIKFALYSGGLLFVFAGLIFIGLNWDKLNGALKLIVTVLVTGFLYASGLFLMSRKFLKFGGVALLSIASSFIPINFAVLQIYIAKDLGVTNETMWLIGSLFAVAVYTVTTIYTRTQSLAYLSLLAMASGVSAIMRIANAPFANYLVAYSILALGFLAAARLAQSSAVTEFTRTPLLLVSQVAAPFLLILSAMAWLLIRSGLNFPTGNPWVAIAAMLVGTAFYLATDWLFGWRMTRWVVGAAFAATILFALFQLQLPLNWIGLAMSVVAVGYLVAAFLLEQRESREDAIPLLAEAQLGAAALFGINAFLWTYAQACGGCSGDSPWISIAAMALGAVFYAATDRLYRSIEARWALGAVFGATFVFALWQLHLPLNTIALSSAVLAIAYLLVAYAIEKRSAHEAAMPFLVQAQLAAPFLLGASVLLFLSSSGENNPWVALGAVFVGATFYGVTDALYRARAARAAWGIAFGAAVLLTLVQLHLQVSSIALGMTVLTLGYLGAAYAFETRSSRQASIPLLLEANLAAPILFFANLWLTLIGGGSGSVWQSIIAMALIVAFYVANDLLFHIRAARWASGIAFAITFLVTLNQLRVAWNAMGLAVAVMALAYLALGYLIEKRSSVDDGMPLFGEAQIMALPLFIANAILWIRSTGCSVCADGSPWFSLGGMFLLVLFYVATDVLYRNRGARWAYAVLLAIAVVFTLTEMKLTPIQTGIILKALALAYLLVGYALERREAMRAGGLPLYATAYAVAAFVTVQSILKLPNGQFDLALALIADTLLLAVSAKIHRNYSWVYGATWLFMVPMYIFARLYVPDVVGQGVALSALMVIYVAAGYGVGQRARYLSGPFLTAAAFLSVVVTAMTWSSGLIAAGTLLVIALSYAFVAVWLRWHWLLVAALAALNLAVAALMRNYAASGDDLVRALAVSYTALGIAFAFGGYALRRANLARWAMPLYLVAGLNSAGAYADSLILQREYAVGASVVFAALALVFAWLERAAFEKPKLKLPPILSYGGAAMLLVGTIFAADWARLIDQWPPFVAGVGALLVLTEWFIHGEAVERVYGVPLRSVGVVGLLVSLIGAVVGANNVASSLTFWIAGAALLADAWYHRNIYWGYAGVGMFVAAIWYLLRNWNVTQLQAYVMPFAFWLVAAGWSEKRLGRRQAYMIMTMLGLLVLMGSALWQSLTGVWYSALLGVESLVALVWGIRTRTRGYVQLAILSLLGNGIVLFWFGFANLDKWLQLSVVGLLLLLIGLVALFRREQVLSAMQEMNRWEA